MQSIVGPVPKVGDLMEHDQNADLLTEHQRSARQAPCPHRVVRLQSEAHRAFTEQLQQFLGQKCGLRSAELRSAQSWERRMLVLVVPKHGC